MNKLKNIGRVKDLTVDTKSANDERIKAKATNTGWHHIFLWKAYVSYPILDGGAIASKINATFMLHDAGNMSVKSMTKGGAK